MDCAHCEDKDCYEGKDCTEIKEEIQEEYKGKNLEALKVSTGIESEFYMEKTRLEELMIYAQRMNYEKLGIAFCIGMEKEAKVIHDILSKEFDVRSVCCKVCGIDKSEFDLKRLHEDSGVEAMCNPVGQAEVLNNEETDLNIILGLCVGHDILFNEHSNAPVTTIAVKDRVLAHNPLGAIYSNYYLKNLLGEEK
ncbi:MAG: DUF1847 domain-containing protein [Hadesarchaea archaeon]|nr:DUF1847 domain-containing protein [Hadesarchaea archaeon]